LLLVLGHGFIVRPATDNRACLWTTQRLWKTCWSYAAAAGVVQ
jgi:hypothetical protein